MLIHLLASSCTTAEIGSNYEQFHNLHICRVTAPFQLLWSILQKVNQIYVLPDVFCRLAVSMPVSSVVDRERNGNGDGNENAI